MRDIPGCVAPGRRSRGRPRKRKWHFIPSVADNIDHNPSSAIYTSSFHGTSLFMFQNLTLQDVCEDGDNGQWFTLTQERGLRKMRDLALSYTELETNTVAKKWHFCPTHPCRPGFFQQPFNQGDDLQQQHMKRTVLHGVHHWGCTRVPERQLPSPSEWGWTCPEQWRPLWSNLPKASAACPELLKYSCQGGCIDCKCVDAHLRCTVYCKCKTDCDNSVWSFRSGIFITWFALNWILCHLILVCYLQIQCYMFF